MFSNIWGSCSSYMTVHQITSQFRHLKIRWQHVTLFGLSFIFLYSFDHSHILNTPILLFRLIGCGVDSVGRISLGCRAEILAQTCLTDSRLGNKLAAPHLISELRRTLLTYAAPCWSPPHPAYLSHNLLSYSAPYLSYSASIWATLHPIWAAPHPIWATLHPKPKTYSFCFFTVLPPLNS